MTQLSTKIFPNVLMTFNSASLTSSYQAIGSLANSARIIKFKNVSTVPVTLSWDGVHDHETLAVNETMIIDVSTNREVATQILEVVANQTFFVKGSAGTGSIYISSYYAY